MTFPPLLGNISNSLKNIPQMQPQGRRLMRSLLFIHGFNLDTCITQFYQVIYKWKRSCGTTAGWKTSSWVHLPLGGKPRASWTPQSKTAPAGSKHTWKNVNHNSLKIAPGKCKQKLFLKMDVYTYPQKQPRDPRLEKLTHLTPALKHRRWSIQQFTWSCWFKWS